MKKPFATPVCDVRFLEDADLLTASGMTVNDLLNLDGDAPTIGFGDIAGTGYLDRLFVSSLRQGEGIGSAICRELEGSAPGSVSIRASITARPFFEKRGWRVVKEQSVERRGVTMTNFVMEK